MTSPSCCPDPPTSFVNLLNHYPKPLLLYKAQVFQHASRRMLLYFIPITILATPLGQITGDRVSTDLVEAIGGCLVTFVACFEMYQKRSLFYKWFCGENEPENKISDTVEESSVGNTTHSRDPISNESSLVATTQAGSQSNDSFDLTYDLGKEVSLFLSNQANASDLKSLTYPLFHLLHSWEKGVLLLSRLLLKS